MHWPVYRIRMPFSNLIQFRPEKVLIEGSAKLEKFQFTTKEKHLNHPILTSWLRLDETRGVLSSNFL